MRSVSIALSLVLVAACHKSSGNGDGGGVGDGGADGGGGTVIITPANASLSVMVGGSATQSYTAKTDQGVDVSASCAWSVVDMSFGSFSGNVFTALPRGGTTTVNAMCPQGSGVANITLMLLGSSVSMGAPANSAALFTSATATTNMTNTPSIEYPLDGAVAPANFPPLDAQWTMASNDLFHVAISSKFVTLDIYTTNADQLFDSATWTEVLTSSIGNALKITVEGLLQATPTMKYASTPVSMTISADTIDNSAIYWWASSDGNLESQVFGSSDAPTTVRGQCTACHSLSRSGTRVGYSRCVSPPDYTSCSASNQAVGFMKYTTSGWTDTMNANDLAQLGSYTTFAPVGNPYPDDTKALAAVAVQTKNLTLYDPDTGTNIASNLDVVSTHDAMQMPTRVGTMPYWSADGKSIVYASATPASSSDTDVGQSQIALLGYTYTNGTHMFTEPTTLISQPVTLSSGMYVNFFFPAFSPDDKYIVFNASKDNWRNLSDERETAARLMLTNAGGDWTIDLTNLNGGDGDYDITWPHWAPNTSSNFYWVVFSSERDYGHLLTATNTNTTCKANGNSQCKQIWMAAIDVTKLNGKTKPTADPSFAPLWLPGQSIAADNISPYWTIPSSPIK